MSPRSAVLSKLMLFGIAPVDVSGLDVTVVVLSIITTEPFNTSGVAGNVSSAQTQKFSYLCFQQTTIQLLRKYSISIKQFFIVKHKIILNLK